MKKIFLSLITAFYSAVVLAQEEVPKSDVTINTDGAGAWYASPWVWVLGAAVAILLLVALTRGGSRKTE